MTGGQWTISGTAATIAAALGIKAGSDQLHWNKVTVKNASGGTAALYAAKNSAVAATPTSAEVELAAGQAYTWGSMSGQQEVDISKIYLVGTANAANIAFISLE